MHSVLLLLVASATAYETDQLTDRHVPLPDLREGANAEADRMLAVAAEQTNERLQCEASPQRTRRVLTKRIHAIAGERTVVPSRVWWRRHGFGGFAAWLEGHEEGDARLFLRPRTDIYSEHTLWHSFILSTIGPSGTFNIAGVLMGSDKPDHFWDTGFRYDRRSKAGNFPLRAIRWGTATELTFYGMFTSKTLSYADLAANWDGYRFYVRLLTEDSELQLDEGGCVRQVDTFDWGEWVSWRWDEVLNPSIHTTLVQNGLDRYLRNHRDEVCASYAEWGSTEYEDHIEEVLADGHPFYADGVNWPRTDPYQLAELCSAKAAP